MHKKCARDGGDSCSAPLSGWSLRLGRWTATTVQKTTLKLKKLKLALLSSFTSGYDNCLLKCWFRLGIVCSQTLCLCYSQPNILSLCVKHNAIILLNLCNEWIFHPWSYYSPSSLCTHSFWCDCYFVIVITHVILCSFSDVVTKSLHVSVPICLIINRISTSFVVKSKHNSFRMFIMRIGCCESRWI